MRRGKPAWRDREERSYDYSAAVAVESGTRLSLMARWRATGHAWLKKEKM